MAKKLSLYAAVTGIIFFALLATIKFMVAEKDTLHYGPFGAVHIYRQSDRPKNIVLFMSGANGWDQDAAGEARLLAGQDALVAGIDTAHYLKYSEQDRNHRILGDDLRHLSWFIMKRYDYNQFTLPVLVGDSAGATLIYIALRQTTMATFAGGISLNFCPEISSFAPSYKYKKMSWVREDAASNTYILQAATAMPEPWIAMQGTEQHCAATDQGVYWRGVPNAQSLVLPGKIWPEALVKALRQILAASASDDAAQIDSLADLPLKIGTPAHPQQKPLAVLISGDGGWSTIDREMSREFNAKGMNVIGIDSLQYFWLPKSADQASQDMNRILMQSTRKWQPAFFVLIGYSKGADVLPFIMTRLPENQQKQIKRVILLAPSKEGNFDFHVMDWLRPYLGRWAGEIDIGNLRKAQPLIPELAKLDSGKVVCIYGEQEKIKGSLCSLLDTKKFKVIELPGSHHFDGNYKTLADRVLQEIGT